MCRAVAESPYPAAGIELGAVCRRRCAIDCRARQLCHGYLGTCGRVGTDGDRAARRLSTAPGGSHGVARRVAGPGCGEVEPADS